MNSQLLGGLELLCPVAAGSSGSGWAEPGVCISITDQTAERRESETLLRPRRLFIVFFIFMQAVSEVVLA